MLFTKQFSFLFPLVCIVLHSAIMFPMVQASSMENIAGASDNQNALNWLTKEMDDDVNEIDQAASDETLKNYIGSFSGLLHNQESSSHSFEIQDSSEAMMTKEQHPQEQLASLAREIQNLNPNSLKLTKQINSKGYDFPYYSDGGKHVLEAFFDKTSPPSFWLDKRALKNVIPLLIHDDHIYFLSQMNDLPFLIYSRHGKFQTQLYGKLKSGLTLEAIQEWKRQNQDRIQ